MTKKAESEPLNNGIKMVKIVKVKKRQLKQTNLKKPETFHIYLASAL
jgi:hypothetical protein